MLLNSLIWLFFFSEFCYIPKYWSSDRIKLLAKSVYVHEASLTPPHFEHCYRESKLDKLQCSIKSITITFNKDWDVIKKTKK